MKKMNFNVLKKKWGQVLLLAIIILIIIFQIRERSEVKKMPKANLDKLIVE